MLKLPRGYAWSKTRFFFFPPTKRNRISVCTAFKLLVKTSWRVPSRFPSNISCTTNMSPLAVSPVAISLLFDFPPTDPHFRFFFRKRENGHRSATSRGNHTGENSRGICFHLIVGNLAVLGGGVSAGHHDHAITCNTLHQLEDARARGNRGRLLTSRRNHKSTCDRRWLPRCLVIPNGEVVFALE